VVIRQLLWANDKHPADVQAVSRAVRSGADGTDGMRATAPAPCPCLRWLFFTADFINIAERCPTVALPGVLFSSCGLGGLPFPSARAGFLCLVTCLPTAIAGSVRSPITPLLSAGILCTKTDSLRRALL